MMFTIAIAQFVLCALLLSTVRPFARKRSWVTKLWIAGQFLIAATLIWSWRLAAVTRAEFVRPKIDRSSLVASFSSISTEGPQRQLVFHYMLENVTDKAFRIDASACSTVSFRFPQKKQTQPGPTHPPNPALDLLEKNDAAYTEFTALVRLPAAKPALSLDQCPLELQPRQKRTVAIAIPYAYPTAQGNNPTQNDLRTYVRTFMPQVEGFGISGLDRDYEIAFPRAW